MERENSTRLSMSQETDKMKGREISGPTASYLVALELFERARAAYIEALAIETGSQEAGQIAYDEIADYWDDTRRFIEGRLLGLVECNLTKTDSNTI